MFEEIYNKFYGFFYFFRNPNWIKWWTLFEQCIEVEQEATVNRTCSFVRNFMWYWNEIRCISISVITWDLNVEIIQVCTRNNKITSLARTQTCSYLWITGGRPWIMVWFFKWQFEAVYTGALDPLQLFFIAETWFYLIGYINTQSYLSADNRRTLHEVLLHDMWGVWRVFTATRLIGPILFPHRRM
jgi:hypothetical protein